MPSYHLVTFSSFQLTTKSILELVYSKVNLDILILFIYNWMLPAASNLIELVGHITDGASATNTSKSVAKINSAEGRVNIQNQSRPNIAPQYLASIWNETNIARYLANFWIRGCQHRNRPGIDLVWQLFFANRPTHVVLSYQWRLFLPYCKCLYVSVEVECNTMHYRLIGVMGKKVFF